MTYYYKKTNTDGNVVSLITCNTHLAESETQIEITEAEYNELYAALPQPEPAPPYEDELTDALTALSTLGYKED